LREPIAVEQVQPAVSVVRHREVELIDRELEDLRIDGGEVAVADVRDRLGGEVLRHDAHGLDRDVDLLGARVDRGLVDLDVARAGGLEILRLLAHDLRQRERGLAQLPARVRIARLLQVIGLAERPDRRREQYLIAHAFTPPAACAAVTSALSFSTATSCGRYSSPVVGASQRYSAGILLSAVSIKRTSSPSVSTRVFRASTIPRTTV